MAMNPIMAALSGLQPQALGPYSPVPPIGAAAMGGPPMISGNPNITQPIMPPLGPQAVGAGSIDANKAQWTGFFDRLRNDPNFRTAIIQAGATMMQPGGMKGELGNLGAGLAVGNQTLNELNRVSRQEQRLDEDREAERAFREEQLQQGQQRLGLSREQLEQTGELTKAQMRQADELAKARMQQQGEQFAAQLEFDREKLLADKAYRDKMLANANDRLSLDKSTGIERRIEMTAADLVATNTTGRYTNDDAGRALARLDAQNVIMGAGNDINALRKLMLSTMVEAWTSNLANIGQPMPIEQFIRDSNAIAERQAGFNPLSETPASRKTPGGATPEQKYPAGADAIKQGETYRLSGGDIVKVRLISPDGTRVTVRNEATGDEKEMSMTLFLNALDTGTGSRGSFNPAGG